MPDGAPDDAVHAIREWVTHRSGIVLDHGRSEHFIQRVRALCATEGISATALLFKLQSGDRRAMLEVVDAASTNYTEFFREREAFELLTARVFPSLRDGPVRIWSAAASTGEEAYSLAIHAQAYFRGETAARVKVLGTDISERHITAAERALYADGRLARLTPVERLAFEPLGMGQSRVRPEVRALCTFRRLNLLSPAWPFTQPFHVILCRNVLYYFDDVSRARLFESLYDASAEGAWLITSFTDPTADIRSRWVPYQPGIFRKEGC